jgi:hypothetical protein
MTITYGTETDFTPEATATSPQTQEITVASNTDMLVLVVTIYDTSSTDGIVSGATFNTTEDFDIVTNFPFYDGTSDGHLCILWLLNPTATTADVSVSFGGTVTDFMASVIEVNGDVGTFEIDVSSVAASTGNGSPSVGLSPVTGGAFFGVMLTDQSVGGRVTLDGSAISMYIQDVGSDTVGAAYETVASGSQTISWSDSDNDEDWIAAGVVFKEVIAAAEYGARVMIFQEE